MISLELKTDLIAAIKKLVEKYDREQYTNVNLSPTDLRGIYEENAQPYRIFFSREYGDEKGLCRILSVSWIGDKPFLDNDLPEWKALVEKAIGHEPGMCGFAFTNKRRIYCMW